MFRRESKLYNDTLVWGFDVTGSTTFDTGQWVDMRRLILPAAFHAVRRAGIRPWEYGFRDAGDGGAIIFKRHQRAASAISTIIPAFTDYIHYRRPSTLDRPLRTRVALHRGQLATDWWGWTGEGLWQTFRMLQSPELASRHDRTEAMTTVAVSPGVYKELLAADAPGIDMTDMVTVDPTAVRKQPPAQPAPVCRLRGAG